MESKEEHDNRNDKEESSFHRIRHRLAVVNNEVPDFLDIENGIYLTDGKQGHILYIAEGTLKVKSKNGTSTLPSKLTVTNDHIVIGSVPIATLPGSVIIGNKSGEKILVGNDIILFGREAGSEITEGSDLIGIGANTLKRSNAVGGSIAIGALAMGDCGKTEMNIGIGKEALYQINDSYNIAFGVEAGRNLTGPLINHNIMMGREAMKDAQASSINIIAMGTQVCSNMKGSNFQSIYIGDKAAQFLQSDILSVNNIGIGSEVLQNARNISDMICMGTSAGDNISGIGGIILGTKAATDTKGTIMNDIIIGTLAGEYREFRDSRSIILGTKAGSHSKGSDPIHIGNEAGKDSIGNDNICMGNMAGDGANGNSNTLLGKQSGAGLTGHNNVCIGPKAGIGIDGDDNVWIGNGPIMSDYLSKCVVMGANIFMKGSEAVVLGANACKSSIGFLNRDIIIGASAGVGQKYNETINENRGLLIIGANAGFGDPDNPEDINSGDLVCIGHGAGHSKDQNFQKSVLLGNYAGSFASNIHNSVIIGQSAGVGMDGFANIYIGPNAGFNVKGDRNILIGYHCGDKAGDLNSTLDNVLAIGHEKPIILGDLKNMNLLIGAENTSVSDWTNGKNSLGFMASDKPTVVSPDISGVLHASGKHLEYTTSSRSTILTFPYKFIHQGEMNGASFLINTEVDGGTLITIKAVPSNKPNLMLNADIMLNVSSGIPVITGVLGPAWNVEVVNKCLVINCTESVIGIMYLEAVGVHILKTLV